MTKSKKRSTKLKPETKPFFFTTTFIGTIVLLAVILAALILVPFFLDLRSQASVNKMRSSVANIEKELNSKRKLDWKDTSHCTIVRGRSFGEGSRYSCNASRQTTLEISSQAQIDQLLDQYKQVLDSSKDLTEQKTNYYKKPFYTEDINILKQADYEHAEQTSVIGFKVKSSSNSTCTIRYELVESIETEGAAMQIELDCVQRTVNAHYEPIEVV